MPASFFCLILASADPISAQPVLSGPAAQADDARPLSAAQIALFETPHLQNVHQPETLDYSFVRNGPAGFSDRVRMQVRQVHPDGSKDLRFAFLTGAHRIAYPDIDSFRGNPLLMLVLERDANAMKDALGLSATYFRNGIRRTFVDQARIESAEITFEGRTIPARIITMQPFAQDRRLARLPTVQQKRYTFVLADGVPGSLAEIRIDMPGDPDTQVPPFEERLTFRGVEP